jgi:hypothetical protein
MRANLPAVPIDTDMDRCKLIFGGDLFIRNESPAIAKRARPAT